MVVNMSPDLELGKSEEERALGKENVTNVLGKENVTNVEVPVALSEPKEQNVVRQPGTHHKGIQQAPLSCGDEEDVHVNIIGNGGKGVEDACVDLTDTECSSSSSFGDTGSGLDSASGSAFSDSEVESEMCDDWSEPPRLRKKKMTDHWRRFSGPLMWRCKWIELQLRKLNSQAMKYEKELAAYDNKKQLEFLKFAVDDFDVKSVPRSDCIQRNKVMKRKKRRRAEECNLSSYVSSHSIFSYYENRNHSPDDCLENFRGDVVSNADNADDTDNAEELKLNDMWSSVDHEDNDKSFIDIIQKVEELLSHVEKLKTRIDNVISENSGKFCSVTQLSIIGQSDGFNHSGHSSASLAGNENAFPVSFVHASSQHKSELYMEDLLLTENTLSTREGITPFVETINRPRLEVPRENTKDEILIQNHAAKKELHGFENVRNQLVEKSKESVEEQKSISPARVSESDLVTNNDVSNAHSTLTACATSKSNFPRIARSGRKKSGPKS